jgi:signal transduction histidine kinase
LQEVFELILTELQGVVPYDSASVQQLHEDYLEIIGGRGFPNLDDLLGVRFDLHASDNPNRVVVQTRGPLILDDAPQAYAGFHRDPHARAKTRSWLGTPLLFGDRVIGMIALDKREREFYTQEHAQLAQAFAAQAAIAIENARLFESERAQLQLAHTLQEVGALLTTRMSQEEVCERIFDLLAKVAQYDSVSLQLLNTQGKMELFAGRGFPDIEAAREVTSKISAQRFEDLRGENHVIVIPDTYGDPRWNKDLGNEYIRSWIGAALLVKGAFIGILNVDSATVNAYDDALGETVSAFANQAAIAIENARMFTELKNVEEALRTLNEELEQRVEARTLELRETNAALQDSLEQLVLMEKMSALGGLVAGIAHELKTPLGVGVTAASHLEEASRELEEQYQANRMKRSDLERYIKVARESTRMILENLRRASDQIQGFKQVAVDQTSDQQRVFHVRAYITDIFLSLHPELRKTAHRVSVSCAEDLEIESYPGAFSQIITNLVMNSLVHGFEQKEQGEIQLSVSLEGTVLWIVYQDDGKGIPPEHLSKIFDPFFTTKRSQGGSGLGLNIVYNLVTQKLRGNITCESILGQETRFIIRIPLE